MCPDDKSKKCTLYFMYCFVIFCIFAIITFIIAYTDKIVVTIDKLLVFLYFGTLGLNSSSVAYILLCHKKNIIKLWTGIFKMDFYYKTLSLQSKSNIKRNLVLGLLPFLTEILCAGLVTLYITIRNKGIFYYTNFYVVMIILLRAIQFINILTYWIIADLFTNYLKQLKEFLKEMNYNYDKKLHLLKNIRKCHQDVHDLIMLFCKIYSTQLLTIILQMIIFLTGYSFQLIRVFLYNLKKWEIGNPTFYLSYTIALMLIIIVPPSICSKRVIFYFLYNS